VHRLRIASPPSDASATAVDPSCPYRLHQARSRETANQSFAPASPAYGADRRSDPNGTRTCPSVRSGDAFVAHDSHSNRRISTKESRREPVVNCKKIRPKPTIFDNPGYFAIGNYPSDQRYALFADDWITRERAAARPARILSGNGRRCVVHRNQPFRWQLLTARLLVDAVVF